MTVAHRTLNVTTGLALLAQSLLIPTAAKAADLSTGYRQQAGGFVQKSEESCDESLRHMALRAKEARATATEGDSFFGQFPKFFTTTDDGVSVEISHVHGRDASGQYGCTSGHFLKVYKNENTKSFMDHVDQLAGAVINGFFPVRITTTNNNNSNGGTQTTTQSPTINGSTATTGPVTVTTGAVTANGGAGGNANAAAAAKAEATAKASATATATAKFQEWKKAHNGDMTGCGCGETNSDRPSKNYGSHWGKQTYNGPNN
jgi:hypothetical protein